MASADREEQIAALVRARELDHRAPSLREASKPLAKAVFEEGKIALDTARGLRVASRDGGAQAARHVSRPEGEAWEEAYRLFSAALRVDPSLSWARRYAEEARGHRLSTRWKDS